MSTIALHAEVSENDRLGLTICLAILIHLFIVLGVSFSPEPIPPSRFESLEVVLVTQQTEAADPDAETLAQANFVGGGNAEASERPSAPLKAPLLEPKPKVAAQSAPASEPVIAEPVEPDLTTQPQPEPQATAEQEVATTTPPLLSAVAEPELAEIEPTPAPAAEDVQQAPPARTAEQIQPTVNTPPLPTAAQLITRSFAMASLNAELQQRLEMRAHRPRRKFISANTKEYRFAAYMEAWRAKVERVGNINYPDEARRRNLSGSLLLDVAINPDGSVREITVRRSSGHQILDDAAVRIVELAAPFAPFPDDFRKEIDILHVTRTWKFLNNARFSSR